MATTKITDGTNDGSFVTTLPASNASGLVVRDAAQGQQTMANSRPVVLASDQTAIPITVTNSNTQSASVPFTFNYKLFDYKFISGENTILWYSSTATGGTNTFPANACSMNVTATNASSSIRQTQRVVSQGGSAMSYQVSAVMGAIKANVRQRIGAFDTSDGLFFEQNGTNLRTVVRIAGVDTVTLQSAWNIDKLDGTGASGLTLNTSFLNVFVVAISNFSAKFGVIINGTVYFCNEVIGANVASPLQNTNFPIRLEITNTAASASATSLIYYAASAFASGGSSPYGVLRSVNNAIGGTATVAATIRPILSIRLDPATPKGALQLESASGLSNSNAGGAIVLFQVWLNPTTLTGAAFTTISADSISQVDTAATAIAGGQLLNSWHVGAYGNSGTGLIMDRDSLLRLSANIAGTTDVLCMTATSSAATTVFTSMLLREMF